MGEAAHADLFPETITSQVIGLASRNGHHIPGTPYTYKHGWVKISAQAQSGAGVAELPKHEPADTLEKYQRPDGSFTPERAALHRQIIDGILAGVTPEEHPVATFFGGGSASGKSTALHRPANSAHIDPDAIKEQLPEYQRMLAERDPHAAAYTHEESSLLSKMAMREARAKRLSYTLDGTGDSAYAKLAAKVGEAKDAGYHVRGDYVTADTEEAVRRSMVRAEATGRMVPPSVIREIHASVTAAYRQAAENRLFDETRLFDTNGAGPKLIAHQDPGQPFTVTDDAAWQGFLRKEHQ